MSHKQKRMPEPFSFRPSEWPSWKRRFERYRTISDLDETSEGKQVSTLVYAMGSKSEEIPLSFNLTDEKTKYDVAMVNFDGHFTPKKNVIYERVTSFCTRNRRRNAVLQRTTAWRDNVSGWQIYNSTAQQTSRRNSWSITCDSRNIQDNYSVKQLV